MLLIRRLPGILYTYRYTAYSASLILSTIIYFLFKWNVLCVNLQAWQHVKRVCNLYDQGLAIGSLCAPLCISKDIHSLTCHSFQKSKKAVFSADWYNIKLVFKSISMDVPPIHWYDNGILKYPTEKEFLATIRTIVKRKLNLTLAYDTAMRLARLKPSYEEKESFKRQLEMDSLWYLLHDNEYLLTTIFTDKDIFPQLIGTCGPFYAVEYLEPAPFSSSIFAIDNNKEEWGQKLRFALQIFQLLGVLETEFREPFHLCDDKLTHFGYTKGKKKLKFIDLNEAFPRTVINSIFSDIQNCDEDSDCELLDCRSTCNKTLHKCSSAVGNNNFQIICEKIFLGWRLSNRIIVPGLLISRETSSELAVLLRQCANPDSVSGKVRNIPAEDIKNQLYAVLLEIEQVNNWSFRNLSEVGNNE